MNNSSAKVNKKVLDYIAIGVVIILVLGTLFIGLSFSSSKNSAPLEDLNLDKYRSASIPEECRLPVYENRVESWKQHLGHHENTHYCLDYFG